MLPMGYLSERALLCRGEQLLLRFFGEGSRQLKLNRASLVKQGAESAGWLFLITCSSTCRSTCMMRDLNIVWKPPARSLIRACSGRVSVYCPDSEKSRPYSAWGVLYLARRRLGIVW